MTGALIVVGAGVGAYLAVRENRAVQTLVAERGTLPVGEDAVADGTGAAVEATEEIITDAPVAPAATASAPPPPPAPSAPRPREVEARAAPPARDPDPTPSPDPPRRTRDEAAAENETAIPTASVGRRSDESDAPPTPRGWERLDEPWPSRSSATPPDRGPRQVTLEDVSRRTGVTLPAEEQPPAFERLVIPADAVIGLQVDTAVSTDDARVEDRVEARVTRDVLVEDRVAIPAGSRVLGSVVLVETVGRLRGTARLGVRFHTVLLDDVVEVPIATETVYREGQSQGADSARKIGGAAIGGAILGAIFGGRQGAAIGGAAGAATGTAAAMGSDGDAATLPVGSTLTVRLSNPATVTVPF